MSRNAAATLVSGRRHWLCRAGCLALVPALGWAADDLPAPSSRRGPDPWPAARSRLGSAAAMSARVVQTIAGLAKTTAEAKNRLDQTRARADELRRGIRPLERERDSLMEEYRHGLFCSGCGQTKSQIEAKGQRFPHRGQSIVRPTEAQLAAKETETQRPVDRAIEQLRRAEAEIDKAAVDLKLGVQQIEQGQRLWRTAVSDHARVHRAAWSAQTDLMWARVNAATEALGLARDRERQAVTTAERAAASTDTSALAGALQRTEDRRLAIEDEARRQYSDHEATVRTERAALYAALNLPPLRTLVNPSALIGDVSPDSSRDGLGAYYLMGRLPQQREAVPEPRRERLAAVARFVDRFQQGWTPGEAEMPPTDRAPEASAGAGATAAPLPPDRRRLLDALP